MTVVRPRIIVAAWHLLPAPLRRKLRSSVGLRFSRFVPVAVASFAMSQITLTVCLGPGHMTAGLSAVIAWLTGAAISYVLSRWAWERKGKPDLVKETLPFWAVAVGAAIILTWATKLANQQALEMGLGHVQRVAFVDAAYFAANCVTFLTRFVLFHYVLFADRPGTRNGRSSARGASGVTSDDADPSGAGPSAEGTGPLAAVGDAASARRDAR
jgi:putative flippase GtrA